MVPRRRVWVPLYRSRNGDVWTLHLTPVFLSTRMVIICLWRIHTTCIVTGCPIDEIMSLVWSAVKDPQPGWSRGECRKWLHSNSQQALFNTLIWTGKNQQCFKRRTTTIYGTQVQQEVEMIVNALAVKMNLRLRCQILRSPCVVSRTWQTIIDGKRISLRFWWKGMIWKQLDGTRTELEPCIRKDKYV